MDTEGGLGGVPDGSGQEDPVARYLQRLQHARIVSEANLIVSTADYESERATLQEQNCREVLALLQRFGLDSDWRPTRLGKARWATLALVGSEPEVCLEIRLVNREYVTLGVSDGPPLAVRVSDSRETVEAALGQLVEEATRHLEEAAEQARVEELLSVALARVRDVLERRRQEDLPRFAWPAGVTLSVYELRWADHLDTEQKVVDSVAYALTPAPDAQGFFQVLGEQRLQRTRISSELRPAIRVTELAWKGVDDLPSSLTVRFRYERKVRVASDSRPISAAATSEDLVVPSGAVLEALGIGARPPAPGTTVLEDLVVYGENDLPRVD